MIESWMRTDVPSPTDDELPLFGMSVGGGVLLCDRWGRRKQMVFLPGARLEFDEDRQIQRVKGPKE